MNRKLFAIKWINTSSIRITANEWGYIPWLITIVISIAVFTILINITDAFGFNINRVLGFILSILICPAAIFYIYYRYKTNGLREIADFMEDTESSERLITKAGKLGLYNWKNKKILLFAVYDSIEKQNDFYYTVKQGDKYGIFSKLSNNFIIPCGEYDGVMPFVDNAAAGNVTKKANVQDNTF